MPEIDYKKLNLNIGKLRVVKGAALELAESKLYDSKNQLLSEFSSHPVTLEIEAGSGSKNISNTLGGYGNLFSFIGFQSGTNPIGSIKTLINKIRLIRKPKFQTTRNGSIFSFLILAPKISDFENASPMPWATGRSWLTGIERGISGLGYFISKRNKGRSGGGEQVDNKLRQITFNRTSYFSKMYSNFLKRLER